MTRPAAEQLRARRVAVGAALTAAGLDGLVVTTLVNVRYRSEEHNV